MELKSVQALVEMYQAAVAAIFGFTTTVPSPILVALTIMRMFPKSLGIGITNLPISAAKFFTCFLFHPSYYPEFDFSPLLVLTPQNRLIAHSFLNA